MGRTTSRSGRSYPICTRRLARSTSRRASLLPRLATLAWVWASALSAEAQAAPGQTQPAQPAPSEPPAAPQPPAAETTTPPRLSSPAALSWPADAGPAPASVDVVLTIADDGTVTEVAAPVSFGASADQAVMAAAQALLFEPARRGTQALASKITFRFELTPPPAAAEPAPPAVPPAPTPPAPTRQAALPEEDNDPYGARARVQQPPPGAATEIKLTGRELTQIPGTFGEPLRVVATLPGVLHSPFGLGFFLVRGASFQNTGFLVDGFAVPLLYHLGAGPAIISSRLVEQLDFYPGGYPVQYGQFTAGIISLRTAPPPTDRVQLELEVDLLRASGLLIVPLPDKRGSVALAFRRSYYELLLPLITDDVSLAYTDYQLRFDYRLSERLRFSLFFFGSRDSLNAAQSLGAGGTTGNASQGLRYAFDQVITSLEWQPADSVRVRWSGTLGPSSVDLTGESTGDSTLGTNTTAMRLGERLELILRPNAEFQTTIGNEISVFIYDVSGSVPSLGELPQIPAPASEGQTLQVADRLAELVFAPYIEQVWRPGRFELTGGLRANYYRYGDVSTWAIDPRGVIRYKIIDPVTLKVASGLFAQPPIPFQLTRSAANPRLAPNRAWQSSFGTELRLPASFEIDSTVYYSLMWAIPRSTGELMIDEMGNPSRPFFEADGRGRAYGFELLLRRRAERGLFGWLSYTLSRSERFLEGGDSIVFAFDQTHVLNLALSYAIDGWTFGARFTLATGRPVGDILDRTGEHTQFDADEDDFDPDSQGRRTRLPTYHQLDVRIDRDWKLGPVKGSVFLDVINVYNAQNSEGYQYSYDFTQRGRLPGFPILPTIGVRGVLQ